MSLLSTTLSRVTLSVLLGSTLCAAPALASDLVIGLQQEPTSLDPTADATASIDGMLAANVYESLTTVTESGEVEPALAESWEISEDGLTYTFKLREGVKYHDDTDFDSADVIFAFNRAMAEDSTNPSKSIFKPIGSVEAPDENTVVITLTTKDAFFLFNLAQGDAAIVAEESADLNNATPVGTGPFKFDSWTRGDRLTLVKNDNWHDAESVQLDRVEFRFISDAAAAHLCALQRLREGAEVSGRAYFVSGDERIGLWTMVDRMLGTAGLPALERSVPAALAAFLAYIIEGVHRLFSLPGEPRITRFVVQQVTHARWFDVSAARRELGYEPKVTIDEGMRRLSEEQVG